MKLQLVIEEVGSDTCRQVLQGTVDINIMGLGKIVEKLVVNNLQKVYAGPASRRQLVRLRQKQLVLQPADTHWSKIRGHTRGGVTCPAVGACWHAAELYLEGLSLITSRQGRVLEWVEHPGPEGMPVS